LISNASNTGILFVSGNASNTFVVQDVAGLSYDNTADPRFLRIGSNGANAEVRFHPSNNSTNYVAFKAPALTNSYTYALPSTSGYSGAALLLSAVSGFSGWFGWGAGGGGGGSVAFKDITGVATQNQPDTGLNNSAQMKVSSPAQMMFYQNTAIFKNGAAPVNPDSATSVSLNCDTPNGPDIAFRQVFARGSACLQIANGQFVSTTALDNATTIPAFGLSSGGSEHNFIQINPSVRNASNYQKPFILHGLDDAYPGRRVYIKNAGNYDVLIKHNSSTCTDKRLRIYTPYGVDMLMRPRDYFTFMYDQWAAKVGEGSL
jgi:hypothetical protein